MIMPCRWRCQAVPFSATPTGPAPYITTNLVGLVKFHAANWPMRRLIGVCEGLNGQATLIRNKNTNIETETAGGSPTTPIRILAFPGFHDSGSAGTLVPW